MVVAGCVPQVRSSTPKNHARHRPPPEEKVDPFTHTFNAGPAKEQGLGRVEHNRGTQTCPPERTAPPTHTDGFTFQVQQIDRVGEVVEETLKGHNVQLLGQSRKKAGAPLNMPKIRKNKLVEIIPINSGCLNQCTYVRSTHKFFVVCVREFACMCSSPICVDESARRSTHGETCGVILSRRSPHACKRNPLSTHRTYMNETAPHVL